MGYSGYLLTAGPALRLAPNTAFGLEASALYDFFIVFHGGVGAIAVYRDTLDAQLQAVVGVGWF